MLTASHAPLSALCYLLAGPSSPMSPAGQEQALRMVAGLSIRESNIIPGSLWEASWWPVTSHLGQPGPSMKLRNVPSLRKLGFRFLISIVCNSALMCLDCSVSFKPDIFPQASVIIDHL